MTLQAYFTEIRTASAITLLFFVFVTWILIFFVWASMPMVATVYYMGFSWNPLWGITPYPVYLPLTWPFMRWLCSKTYDLAQKVKI